MQPDTFRLRISAFLGLAAIVLGSMGAHGKVHDALVKVGALENWQTAVDYHIPHAIFLFALAFVISHGGKVASAAWNCLLLGLLLFSGSLYLHGLTQVRWLVYVTPVGGLALIIGWALLMFSPWKRA